MASISITDTRMDSDSGFHAIHDGRAWVVSWCPELRFDRNLAITALTLAELVSSGAVDASHRKWPLIRDFAAELGMTPAEAVHLLTP
jgi:hypothetical protein